MGVIVKETVNKLSQAAEGLMERIIAERDAMPPNSKEKALLRRLGVYIDQARLDLAKAVRCLEDAE